MPKKAKDKLTREGKKFFAELQKLCELEVQVGFTAGKSGHNQRHDSVTAEDYNNDTTIAEVAAWNEFGTKHIPARPFLRQSVDKNIEKIKKVCAEQVKGVKQGKIDAEQALCRIGALQVGHIQAEIRKGNFVENAESTIRIKNKPLKKSKKKKKGKATTPLIDTGRLHQSVHYVVKSKKGQ